MLHLLRERHLSRSSVNQYGYGCAYRFLCGTVLGLDGQAFQIPLAAAPQRLLEIFSRERTRTPVRRRPPTDSDRPFALVSSSVPVSGTQQREQTFVMARRFTANATASKAQALPGASHLRDLSTPASSGYAELSGGMATPR